MSNQKNDINFLRAKLKKLESLLNKKDAPAEQTLNDVSGTLKNLKDAIDTLDLSNKLTNYDIDLSDLKGFKANTGIDLTDLKGFKTNTGIDLTDLKGFKTSANMDLTDLKSFKTDTGLDLTDLKSFKTNANVDLSDLKGFKTSANLDLTDLKSFKTNTGIDLTDLKGFKTSANTDLTDLKGFKTTANTDLTDLKSFKTNANVDLSDLKGFKTSANTDLTDLKGFKTSANTDLTDLKTFKTSANTDLTDLKGFKTSANTDLTDLKTFKTSANTDLTDLKSFKSTANTDLTDLKSFKTSANTDLTDLKSFKTTANTDLTDLKGFKTSANTDLTGLKSFKTGLEDGTSIPSGLSNTFRTSAQVNSAIGGFDFSGAGNSTINSRFGTVNTTLSQKANSSDVYSRTDANNTFRTATQVNSDIGSFNFENGTNPTITPISRFNTVSQSHASYTGSYNSFSSSQGFKLSSFAFSAAEESAFKFASLASLLKTSFFSSPTDPTTGYDKGKWYFTNTFPSGNADYKLTSYSYQGYDTQERYNKEDFITYRKRLYTINSNAYTTTIAQESELLLQAGKTTIRAGTPNNTTPALKIIGESAISNGVSDDQGQLLLQDEDNTSSGLMLGYKYVSSGNEYGRIQAKNSLGAATDLYINAAGGSVRISRLNNHAIDDSAIELNSYGSGDRNSYIDFHSYGNQDYDSRIIRWSGQAGIFELTNTYSRIRNSVSYIAGTIFDWIHAGSTKMYLESNGNLTLAGNLSDERIKTDIATSSLGLEFINNLNPVQFKFIVADEIIDITKEKLENNKIINDGSRKAGVRNHYGFIAQEVKKAAGGKDFAGIAYEPEKDLYKLNHQEFISPMVKAIQELSQKNDYLEKKLEEKEKQLQDILSRLTALENK